MGGREAVGLGKEWENGVVIETKLAFTRHYG